MTAVERRPVQAVNVRVVPRVPAAQPPRELETWTDTRYALLDRVRKASKRGEIREAGSWVQVPGTRGWYAVKVWRLKPETPAWRRAVPWVIGGLVALAAVLLAVGYVLSMIFAAIASVPVWVWVLVALVLLAGGGGATTVIVKVIVR